MKENPKINLLAVAAIFGCSAISSYAQDCFDLINGLPAGQTMQCAGCGYFSTDSDFFDETELFETRSGLFSAAADGLNMFTAADPRPASVLAPFSSATDVTATRDAVGITRIEISQSGEVSLAPRNIWYQNANLDCMSRVVFVPQKAGGNPAIPVPVTFSLDFTVLVEDDLPGVGSEGAVYSRATIDLEAPGFFATEFEGLVEFDRDTNPVPVFTGDFAGLATAVPEGDGFRVSAQFDVILDLLPGEQVHLDASSSATLASDEFWAGPSERWSVSTPEAIVFTITSSDPGVRFEVVPEDPPSGSDRPKIVEWQQLSMDGDETTFQIVWTSTAGSTYRIESSTDTQNPWTTVPGKESIASQGSRTTSQVVLNTEDHPSQFLRIVRQ